MKPWERVVKLRYGEVTISEQKHGFLLRNKGCSVYIDADGEVQGKSEGVILSL